jgi:hypothetical protein
MKVKITGDVALFWCPGCKELHAIGINKMDRPNWSFNGLVNKPTFSPSVLVKTGHYVDGDTSRCFCRKNEQRVVEGKKPHSVTCSVCHSFVTDGKIQFLNDCTHELAGLTVELPDYPTELEE